MTLQVGRAGSVGSSLPLSVVVSLATEDVFSAWRRNAILVGIGTLLLCSALLTLTWLLGRE